MSEFKVGDEVWVKCKVTEGWSGMVPLIYGAVAFRADPDDCKLVEPEAVEQPVKKEPTEAQKIAERTLKAIWATQDQPKPEPDPQRPFQVGDLVEVCNPHLGTHGHRGVVTEVLAGLEGVKVNINNCWFVLSHKSLRLAKPEPDPVVEQPSTTEPEAKRPETTTTHYGPDISKVSFEFTQEPNTLGTTDASGCGSEDLIVECEYQLPGDEPFFVIRSTSGWSFDEPETLLALLNSVKDAEKKCRCSLPRS